jgi:hypothetical protein
VSGAHLLDGVLDGALVLLTRGHVVPREEHEHNREGERDEHLHDSRLLDDRASESGGMVHDAHAERRVLEGGELRVGGQARASARGDARIAR